MKPFAQLFASLFDRHEDAPNAASRRSMYREWDRQRQSALTPSDRSEIDAIFSRSL
ncbi:MAG: hypothetical protein NWR45_10815 [Candidatus Nanopelagicales bacterium]|jgi:hypothetical protein|nr:hypothetical protein [Candidatus Nanopelagicales bacterium]